jgi:ubiquinone/menaquinone biosynthesis C-methylase UbiE
MPNIYDCYDKIPGNADYEAYNSDIAIQKFWQKNRINWIIERAMEIEGKKNKSGADLGCGSGVITRQLSAHYKEFIGLDISNNAIEYCNNKRGVNDTYIRSNLEKIPLNKESINLVVCSEVIEHVEKYETMMLEIKRILKKNGVLILTTPNYSSTWPFVEFLWDVFGRGRNYRKQHISKMSIKKIKKLMEDNNFKIIEIKTFFLLSPFLCIFSERLANKLFKLENRLLIKTNIGMIILLRAVIED